MAQRPLAPGGRRRPGRPCRASHVPLGEVVEPARCRRAGRRTVVPGRRRTDGRQVPCARRSSFTSGSPISAVASSTMSIPAGHQVVHRPQPTQPAVPNCSGQVCSLWVSHWRYLAAVVARTGRPPRLEWSSWKHEAHDCSRTASSVSSARVVAERRAEAGGAHQRAVAARQAALGDVVPVRMVLGAGQQPGQFVARQPCRHHRHRAGHEPRRRSARSAAAGGAPRAAAAAHRLPRVRAGLDEQSVATVGCGGRRRAR